MLLLKNGRQNRLGFIWRWSKEAKKNDVWLVVWDLTGLLSVLSPRGLLWGCRSWRTAPLNDWEDPGKQNGTLVWGFWRVMCSRLKSFHRRINHLYQHASPQWKLTRSVYLVTSVAITRGAGLGDFLKIPANPPLFSWNVKTFLINDQPQRTGWDVPGQTTRAPSKCFLQIDFHSWRITSSPRLCLIPERTTKCKRRVTQTHSECMTGPSLYLFCRSALCWFLSLLKHATENTLLLKTDSKLSERQQNYKTNKQRKHKKTYMCTLNKVSKVQAKLYQHNTFMLLFSGTSNARLSVLAVTSFWPSLSWHKKRKRKRKNEFGVYN